MTLSRILAVAISVLMAVVFVGTLMINVRTTRDYVAEQLTSHAQDTATSLGLSITAAGAGRDPAAIQSTVDAIFDRGYYRDIIVTGSDGQRLLERTLPVEAPDVPGWFVRAIPLETPEGESVIMDGWRQVASIRVRSHPGYAYAKLWFSARELGWWFTLAWLSAVVLVVLALRVLLAPLRAVEQQALAISDRQFRVLDSAPWTRELQRVVAAMNSMSVKVKLMFGEQANMIERIREDAHRDAVTGFSNRRHFLGRVNHLLNSPDEFGGGLLVLIQLDGLQAYNDAHGRQAGDALIADAARYVESGVPGGPNTVFARLDGTMFAILLGGTDQTAEAEISEALLAALTPLALSVSMGTARSEQIGSAEELLAAADARLRDARSRERQLARATEERESLERLVRERIAAGALSLHYQPVRAASDGHFMHHEVLVRIEDFAGRELPAGVFMGAVARLGLSSLLDRQVVNALVACMDQPSCRDGKFAINLSVDSLADRTFVHWLGHCLPAGVGNRVVFEIPQPDADQRMESLGAAIIALRTCGVHCALDHFGAEFSSFSRLIDLPLDYIKFDGALTRGIADCADSRAFVSEVAKMARAIGLPVCAGGVENAKDQEVLIGCGVDGLQGYFVGRPARAPAVE